MQSIGLVELKLAGKAVRLVSQGGRDARRVVKALGIKTLDPPWGQKKPTEEGPDEQT